MEEKPNVEQTTQNPEPKKSNKGFLVVVCIMAIIIVALVGYIIYQSKVVGEKENETTTTASKSSEEKETSKENKSKKKDNTSKTSNKKDDTKNSEKENKSTKTSNKSFGSKNKKSDKNNTDNKADNKADEKVGNKVENKAKDNKAKDNKAEKISEDWKSGEFILDGVSYKLNGEYKDYTDKGWAVDFKALGYADGYILNKNDKTYSTADLKNSKYPQSDVNVGFINLSDSAKDVSECQIWAVSVDNKFAKTPVDFTLPGGIKYGSTLAEIEAVYGKPESENNIYRAEELKYTTYTYDNDLKPQLRLTIYDDIGLTEFEYKIY